jgi:23S rRNA pseudouridine955/2504/2580 synthase
MHLHARRIRIDHPDGGTLDVTAELPDHFSESMGLLGFDQTLGDAMTLDEKAKAPSRAAQKARAKAHAKTVRKERRGERGRRRG